jgi:hypothetical protein
MSLRKPPLGYKNANHPLKSPAAYDGINISFYVAYINETIEYIKSLGGIDIVISYYNNWDYDPDEYYLRYFMPMTETEIEQQKNRSAKAKAAAAAKKEKKIAKEREEYERLKAKFEN